VSRLRTLSPARAGVVAYLVVAAVMGAWLAVVVVAIGWALVEHHRRDHTRTAVDGPNGSPAHSRRGLVALVLGVVLVLRDGVARTAGGVVLAVVVAVLVLVVAVLVVTGAGNGLPLAGAVVGAVVAAVVRHHGRPATPSYPSEPDAPAWR
jgi:hypothetical protein